MKCDRRWWNDGALERQVSACVSAWPRVEPPPVAPDDPEAFAVRIVCESPDYFPVRMPEVFSRQLHVTPERALAMAVRHTRPPPAPCGWCRGHGYQGVNLCVECRGTGKETEQ